MIEKITKKTICVNGKTQVVFDDEETLAKVLAKRFKTQGDLYEEIFNIKKEDAELAGWSPKDDKFQSDPSDGEYPHLADTFSVGWWRFLKAGGQIQKVITVEEIGIGTLISSMFKELI